MSTNPYASPSQFGDPSSYRAPTPEKPVAGIVFGILNVIFGLLGLCGTAFSALIFFIPVNPQMAAQNPVLKLMNDSPVYRLFMQGSIVLGFVATFVLLAAGTGLLMQRPFGRQLSIGYAIYGIITTIVALLVNIFVVFPLLMKNLNDVAPGPEQAGAMGGAIGGIVGGVIGSVLSLIYPALLLYFMYTPKVIAAYSSDRPT